MVVKQFIVILFLLSTLVNIAQLNDAEKRQFKVYEDSIRVLIPKVFRSKVPATKIEANKQLIALWSMILKDEKSLYYPFDSIKNDISVITAPDNKFRIITWNLLREDESHFYFGFIQINNSKAIKKNIFNKIITNQYDVFPLIDKSAGVANPELYVGEPSKWFGMLYVDVIKTDDDFYTLIGWDGHSKITQRKFIDILIFKPDGTPVFGKDVFKIPNRFAKRVMFEYASEVTMSLKFNKDRKQIIMSHLAPNVPDDRLIGQYQYYGPDGSFDALEMKKGKWTMQADIDIRKIKDKNDNTKKPEQSKQTPIYKPK